MADDREKLTREYLAASGATAISITKLGRGVVFSIGRGYVGLPDTVLSFWLETKMAGKVVRLARRNVPVGATRYAAEKELHHAAAAFKVKLTPDIIVQSRATFAAKRLAVLFDGWSKNGALSEFNREFKRRRTAAVAAGKPFMNFTAASTRLRKIVIVMLIRKQQIGALSSFFDEVFK